MAKPHAAQLRELAKSFRLPVSTLIAACIEYALREDGSHELPIGQRDQPADPNGPAVTSDSAQATARSLSKASNGLAGLQDAIALLEEAQGAAPAVRRHLIVSALGRLHEDVIEADR